MQNDTPPAKIGFGSRAGGVVADKLVEVYLHSGDATQQARHDSGQLYSLKWHLTRLLYQHGWTKRRTA